MDIEEALQSQSGTIASSIVGALEGHCCNNCGCYSVMLLMDLYQFLAGPVFKASGGLIAQDLPVGSVSSGIF